MLPVQHEIRVVLIFIPGNMIQKKFKGFLYNKGDNGMGLSIAKAIAELHKGKIVMTGKHGEWIQLDVVL